MKKEIAVPRMGESISEAHIGQIFKPTGSFVQQDDEILELETDKANQVINAPQSGIITWTVTSQDKVSVDQVIGSIDSESVPPANLIAETKKATPFMETKKEDEVSSARLFKEDYLKTLSPPLAVVEETKNVGSIEAVSRRKMSRIRQTIASRLVQAKTETAMLTTFNEVDLTEIIALRDKYKEAFQRKFNAKLGFMSFFVKAAVAALQEYPLVNAMIEGDEIVDRKSVDMGIAVSTEKGLIVPVIRAVENLNFAEIEQQIEHLGKKAREGHITLDDISGGTFTITNGGTFGSLLSTPILNFPQSAILGMHKIQKRPVVVDDEIKIRSMMYLALTYDHRLIDGREAVLFLVHIKNLLEDPGRFLLGV